jgi:hypothetical protein
VKKAFIILAFALVAFFGVSRVDADPTNGTIWVWTTIGGNPKPLWINYYTVCSTTEPGANTGSVRCSAGAPSGGGGEPNYSAPVSILD